MPPWCVFVLPEASWTCIRPISAAPMVLQLGRTDSDPPASCRLPRRDSRNVYNGSRACCQNMKKKNMQDFLIWSKRNVSLVKGIHVLLDLLPQPFVMFTEPLDEP